MLSTYLKPNIQLFAEPDPDPAGEPPKAGKTYSEDYVGTLRGESDGYRTRAKSYEGALRNILGLEESEELGDINSRLTAHQQAQTREKEEMLSKGNLRLIMAELKSLPGYDHKLLTKVLDLKQIKVDDSDTVVGLKEAVIAAEKEYPAVKLKTGQYAPENPAAGEPPAITKEQFAKMTYNEKYELKQKHPDTYKKLIGGN